MKLIPSFRLEADTSTCAPAEPPVDGTGVIQGEVLGPQGVIAIRGAAVRATNVDIEFTYETQTRLVGEPGRYELEDLPVGEYEMEVEEGGRCAFATVFLNEDETVTQDFTLSEECP